MSYLRLWMFAILLLFVNPLVWACCDLIDIKECQPHWYASIGIGDSVDYRAGTGSFLFNLPGEPSIVTISPNYNNVTPIYFQGEIGYIWNRPFASDLNNNFFPFMTLGIQYRHTKPITLTTEKLDSTAPGSISIPYRVEQDSALLTWKIDFYQWLDRIMPYLNLGLGASWNHTSQVEPVIANPPDDFINTHSKTNTAWSYSIGAGLDFIVATNFWLSLGYSYDNFGQLQLGNSFRDPDPTGSNAFFQPVNLGNFHAHNVIFTARYLFG